MGCLRDEGVDLGDGPPRPLGLHLGVSASALDDEVAVTAEGVCVPVGVALDCLEELLEVLVHGGFALEVRLGTLGPDGAEEEDAQHRLVSPDAVGLDVGDPLFELGSSVVGDGVVLATSRSLVADFDEAAVGSVEVVEVFPLLELVVEDVGVVDDGAVEESVELFGVDAMGSLHFAVQPGVRGLM